MSLIRAPTLGRYDNVLLRKLSIRAPTLGRDGNTQVTDSGTP